MSKEKAVLEWLKKEATAIADKYTEAFDSMPVEVLDEVLDYINFDELAFYDWPPLTKRKAVELLQKFGEVEKVLRRTIEFLGETELREIIKRGNQTDLVWCIKNASLAQSLSEEFKQELRSLAMSYPATLACYVTYVDSYYQYHLNSAQLAAIADEVDKPILDFEFFYNQIDDTVKRKYFMPKEEWVSVWKDVSRGKRTEMLCRWDVPHEIIGRIIAKSSNKDSPYLKEILSNPFVPASVLLTFMQHPIYKKYVEEALSKQKQPVYKRWRVLKPFSEKTLEKFYTEVVLPSKQPLTE